MNATSERVTAYIGVGANLGFARDAVLNALLDLERLPDSEFIAASSLYRSAPLETDGPDFINAVAMIDTALAPRDLLHALLAIEARHGRVRTTRNAPRTLDLDLLLHGDTRITSVELSLPHPRMTQRAFVLRPLAELTPDLEIPGAGRITELLKRLPIQDIERLEP